MKFKHLILVIVLPSLLIDAEGKVFAAENPAIEQLVQQIDKDNPLPSKKLIIPTQQAITQLATEQRNDMVFVQGGTFMMGPGSKESQWIAGNNQPRHPVTLSGYYISKYLVTFSQYDLYTKLTQGEWIIPSELRFHDTKHRAPQAPAQGVTWYQAEGYCKYLAQQTGLPYDLPTEAQWEYAARSRGQEVNWASDDGTYKPGKNTISYEQTEAYYQALNTGTDDLIPFPLAVGSFPPNPLGMYDMAGAVQEWVKDWSYSYPSTSQINPQGAKTGTQKMMRGGSVASSLDFQGIYFRDAGDPKNGNIMGFRCVINSTTPPAQLGAFAK
jgi:sulfatase modifying factor 1